MASVNKVTLIGNLGRDPELRYMPDGKPTVTINLATTHAWKDKGTGERQEHTEWHRVVFYGRLAEVVGEYLAKGSQAYVEGRLRTDKWTDKDGVERYSTVIVATELQMLGGKRKEGTQHGQMPAGGGSDDGPYIDDDAPF